MKNILLLLLSILLTIGGTSCRKIKESDLAQKDYLIVGWSGGMVYHVRDTYFKVTDTSLLKDTSQLANIVPANVKGFNFNIVMPDSCYAKVKDLIASIPAELLNHKFGHYGRGAIDSGPIEVWASVRGIDYEWWFEYDQAGSSVPIQQFVERLEHDF